ncbi:hypothetical protein DFJ73DRAFT_820738, partial [Zopfochytrium polystomum]
LVTATTTGLTIVYFWLNNYICCWCSNFWNGCCQVPLLLYCKSIPPLIICVLAGGRFK